MYKRRASVGVYNLQAKEAYLSRLDAEFFCISM